MRFDTYGVLLQIHEATIQVETEKLNDKGNWQNTDEVLIFNVNVSIF